MRRPRPQGHTCFECGKPARHAHHVVPYVLGGRRTVPLCTACHGKVHGLELAHHRRLQRAGIAAAQAAGVAFGRPKGTGKPLKATPERCELVRRLKAEGKPVARIARLTGLSRQTVYSVLAGAG